MIRIRFPRGIDPPSWLLRPPVGVELTDDPAVIAAENEKNGAEQFAAVERVLRPRFRELWHNDSPLFKVVLIESRAGCNYNCEFCPVAEAVDPRPPGDLSI